MKQKQKVKKIKRAIEKTASSRNKNFQNTRTSKTFYFPNLSNSKWFRFYTSEKQSDNTLMIEYVFEITD